MDQVWLPTFLVRQLAVLVQQLRNGEEEEPKTDHGGKDAQDEDGGAAMVQMTSGGGTWIEIGIGDAAKSDPGAKGRHEQKRKADDDADVEHGNRSVSGQNVGNYSITRCCDRLVSHVKLPRMARDRGV